MSRAATADAAGATIDPAELSKFRDLAESWWDPNGKLAPLHALNPLRIAWIRDRVVEHFRLAGVGRHPLASLSILDIGCGGGLLSEPLARLGASVTGIDPLATNIDTARWHAEQSGVEVNYEAATSEDLVAAGRQFDVVLAMEVVEHVSDVETFMADIGSLVRPGGFVVLSTVSRTIASFMLAIVGAEYLLRWLPRGTHVWSKFITPSELAGRLRTAGLSPRSVTGVEYDPARREFRLGRDPGVNYMMSATAPRGRA
ncbi:MAG: bifunctional 2-polyprenyl-6-hydroxyphenol methylase/3-demethylubiquinol 3-O-methyltransferase UbiG [Geminicoccaceae bacterium]